MHIPLKKPPGISILFLLALWLMTNELYAQTPALPPDPISITSLDHITLGKVRNDSAAARVKEAESLHLNSGDTLLAFIEYMQWMENILERYMQTQVGADFEPYLQFASHHPSLKNHFLYQFFNGIHQSHWGSIHTAVEQLLQAEKYIETQNPELAQFLYFEVSNNFLSLNDYQGAVDYGLKSLETYQRKGDKKGELAARLVMATSFAKQNRFEETIRQREQGIQLAHETGEYGQLIFIYVNNAIDQRKLKNYEQSLEYYKNAYTTLDTNTSFLEENLRYFKSIVDLNLLTLWNDMGWTDSVLVNYQPVIDSVAHYGVVLGVADGHVQAGRAYIAKTDYSNAQKHLLRADSISGELGFDDKRIDANKYLAQMYRETGQFQKASDALTTWIGIENRKDSLFNNQLVQTLQMRYESDRQQEIIAEKELEVGRQKKQRETNTRLFFASLGGLILVSTSLFLWRNKKQLQREKQIEIDYNRRLIEYQESENHRVSKELHDGVGQSLMMIKNKIMLGDREDTARMVGDTLEEIRSISRQLHPFTLQKLGLSAALEKLLKDFDENTDMLVDSTIDPVDDRFTDKAALNIFRIVQESLNNVLKHSKARALTFTLKGNNQHCHINIEDNGKGFDVSENFSTVSSLGLKTLKERTSILGGQMKISSETNKGTTVQLKVPYDV